ncbi:catechol 2,3-dioxygenase-like lactoylglutathione lyase family enzyme [Rhodovulum iodosum]|uniref:Catechol 2,3-dioxygenase-like lactoylglutathione lyase family enzyme n=1 Tax=Rhodovulum iodosum TaxID=68291 RepID=A0ABV3XSM0_9RHOB|nr:VOC family protein [Rhodovulum robiginosum]RSK30634.1 glyoxalase [Rhodovulum robiginosum]
MFPHALHHVQLAMPAGGEDAGRAFYRDLLGLEEEARPEALDARGGVWFYRGELRLHLGVEEGFRPARKAHPALMVADLDALAERLERAGCALVWDEAIPQVRRFFIDDPFGNRIELMEGAR